jgi:hypothetical protein
MALWIKAFIFSLNCTKLDLKNISLFYKSCCIMMLYFNSLLSFMTWFGDSLKILVPPRSKALAEKKSHTMFYRFRQAKFDNSGSIKLEAIFATAPAALKN